MDKGWIKLHRKILKNQFLNFDTTARYVFIMLMLLVDKKTGEWSGGRKQLAEITGINDATLYCALDRLVDQHMINRKPTAKFTTYQICKWSDYQSGDQTPVNTVSTARQHSNKNREVRIKKNTKRDTPPRTAFMSLVDFSTWEQDFPLKDVRSEHEKAKDWLLSTGKQYKDYPAFFRGWLRRSNDKPSKRPMLVIGRKS